MENLLKSTLWILNQIVSLINLLWILLPVFVKEFIELSSIIALLILQYNLISFLIYQFFVLHVSLKFLISELHLILLSKMLEIGQKLIVFLEEGYLFFFDVFLVLFMLHFQLIWKLTDFSRIELLCFHDVLDSTISQKLVARVLISLLSLSFLFFILIP